MKKRIIMFFVVLTLLIATTCMLTACGGSDLKKGNSIVDITDVEVETDADGDITGTKYQDKKIEVSYLVGENTYIQLSGNKASEMKVSGYSGAVTTLSLKELEKKVDIDGEPLNINGIAPDAFAGCDTLTSVDLTKQNESLNFRIASSAFMSCTNLTTVVLPDKVFSNENAIGEAAFFNCNALNSVTGMEKFPILKDLVFGNCSELATIELSSNTTYIPDKLFANSEKLANITLPASVKVIGEKAFLNTAVTGIDFSTMTNLLAIGADAFRDAKLTSVNLPDSIINIGNGAFYNNKLKTVNIPFLGASFVQSTPWKFDNVYGAEYDAPKPDPDAYGEYIYPEYAKTEVTVRSANSLDKISFAGSTIAKLNINFAPIGEKPIYMMDVIERDLGNNIIANDVVYATISKLDIEKLPDSLPEKFLFNAKQLESVTIPNITKIGAKAFANTSAFKDISSIFNENVTSVGNAAFEGSGVENVVIPDNIESFGAGIFNNCDMLTSITFNKFYNDASMMNNIYGESAPKNLTTVNIGENVTDIPANAFKGLTGLTTLNVAGTLESIGAGAFDGCIALPGYYNSVTVLNNWVVKKNNSVSNVVLPTSVVGLANGTIDEYDNIYYSGTEDQFNAIKNTGAISFVGDITLYAEGDFVEDNGIVYYLDGTSTLCVFAVNSNDKIITIKDKLNIGGADHSVTKLMNGAFFNVNNDILFLPATVTSTESAPFLADTIKTIEYGGTSSQYNALKSSGNFSMITNYNTDVVADNVYTYIVKENGVEIFRTTGLYIDYKYDKLGYKLISTKAGDTPITFPYKSSTASYGDEVIIDLVTKKLETPEFVMEDAITVNNSFTYTFVKIGDKYCANNLSKGNTTARCELLANKAVQLEIIFNITSEERYDYVKMSIVDASGHENSFDNILSGTNVVKSYTIDLDINEKFVIKYTKDGSGDVRNEMVEFSYNIN